jgi:hypothetical protein
VSAGDEYYEDLLKIEMLYTGEHNTAANVFYASCAGAHGATLTQLGDIASSLATAWVAQVMPYIIEAIALEFVKVSDWTDADGLSQEEAVGTSGSLTGEALADQVAGLINYTTLLRYRGGRGRAYIPQPNAAQLSNGGTWTTDYINNLGSGFTNWVNVLNDITIGDDALTFVLYHRSGNKVVEQGFEEVVGTACSATPGTQRRRVRRVGHKR